jgi:hypothetical protein
MIDKSKDVKANLQQTNPTTVDNTIKAVDKKEGRKEKRVSRNKAFDVIKELVDKQEDKKYKEALTMIRPSLYGLVGGGGASGGVAAFQKFVSYIEEKKSVDELTVFKEFKVGRKEAAGFLKTHLKRSEPEKRIWIEFNRSSGVYKFVGKGKDAPQGYNGFIPANKTVDLNMPNLK